MTDTASLLALGAWRSLLHEAGDAASICVAYSGGGDSSALLHHLCALRSQGLDLRVRALHVDHRLHADSRDWAGHCVRACRSLGVDVEVCVVDATAAAGESPEAAARTARYAVLAEHLGSGEVLVTAQHADDQAETLLLQLLRGAGPEGLAAMPRLTRFAHGWLARPLLDVTRATLAAYCRAHGLRWLEDPANRDPRHDRSYLRANVLPLLTGRWPGTVRTLTRAATHQAAAAQLLEQRAREDLGEFATTSMRCLPVALLSGLTPARRANALRGWLRLRGAPMPSSVQLDEMLREMLGARIDATPEIAWGPVVLRRFAGNLHLCPRGPEPGPQRIRWPDVSVPLDLHHGRLSARAAVGSGVRAEALARGDVEVRLRRGGERLRPSGDRHTRALKKLLHAAGMPPWQRTALPLIYAGDELLLVPGLCIAEGAAARPGEAGVCIRWLPETSGETCGDE